MLRQILPLLCILGLIGSPALASSLAGSCEIRFFGDSTLHAFDGRGACEPFELESEDGRHYRSATVEVKVARLDTGIARRDKQMRKMFSSDSYPLIRGWFQAFDSDQLLKTWQADDDASLPFELQIREVSLPLTAEVRELVVSAEKITFTLDYTLSLDSFQLEAPTVLGIIRVDDAVRLEVDVELNREEAMPDNIPSQ